MKSTTGDEIGVMAGNLHNAMQNIAQAIGQEQVKWQSLGEQREANG